MGEEQSELMDKVAELKTKKDTRVYALNHTQTLCVAQEKDLVKEMKLANYIAGLIQKRVQKIKLALQKFNKNSEECAKLGVGFWCASESNMKQCSVTQEDCDRMKASEVSTDMAEAQGPKSANSKTGMTGGSAATGIARAAESGSTGTTGSSMTGMTGTSAQYERKRAKANDFQKLLKIFDQNKDKRIGWDEIIAVTKK